MGLQKITVKHREIMRRMLTRQTTEEISLELMVSTVYLNMLKRDPLFIECLEGMEGEIHNHWVENRTKAMDILEDNAAESAKLCTDAVGGVVATLDADGGVAYETVPLKERLSSAWDVLNRTGNKAVEKKVVAHTTLQEMIITAYQQRTGAETPASSTGSQKPPEQKIPELVEQNVAGNVAVEADIVEGEYAEAG